MYLEKTGNEKGEPVSIQEIWRSAGSLCFVLYFGGSLALEVAYSVSLSCECGLCGACERVVNVFVLVDVNIMMLKNAVTPARF
jgi:hypothetical protein